MRHPYFSLRYCIDAATRVCVRDNYLRKLEADAEPPRLERRLRERRAALSSMCMGVGAVAAGVGGRLSAAPADAPTLS